MSQPHPRAPANHQPPPSVPHRCRSLLPWLALAAVTAAAVLALRVEGRRWWCACGRPFLWSGDTQGAHNSQHLFDPYSFTHVLHGLALCGLLAWAGRRLAPAWRLVVAVGLEAVWEVAENSPFVIQRYRTATLAVGYEGDTVANSLGDIVCCAAGFALARRLGLRASVAVFLVTEAVLLAWIRDDLLLSVVMLVYPVEAIKAWQTAP
jgi:Protein of unknown function (DUF2585)